MREPLATLVRTSAFLRKEVVDMVRQPRLLVTLVLGPFLVLLAFGAGLVDRDPPMATMFVAPQDDELAAEVIRFAEAQEGRLDVRGITTDEHEARGRLEAGELDMIVVFPPDAQETVRDNEHAQVVVYHNLVDPIETRAMELFLRTAVDEINAQVLRSVVADGQSDAEEAEPRVRQARQRAGMLRAALEAQDEAAAAGHTAALRRDAAVLALVVAPVVGLTDAGAADGDDRLGEQLTALLEDEEDDVSAEQAAELEEELVTLEERLGEFTAMSPEVMVSPFRGAATQLGVEDIELADFYAPAVLILLLQHLVVTFIGLSLVRDEELGTNEMFRTSPIRPAEVLAGKALAYLLIGGAVAAALLGLLVAGLGTPLVGSIAMVVAIVAAVLAASIGLGCVIALVSRSDSQAVQYAMLVLLATIFFSGFLLDLDRFLEPLRIAAYALPATHGIELLRDTMLRGRMASPHLLAILSGMAVALFMLASLLLRRRMQKA